MVIACVLTVLSRAVVSWPLSPGMAVTKLGQYLRSATVCQKHERNAEAPGERSGEAEHAQPEENRADQGEDVGDGAGGFGAVIVLRDAENPSSGQAEVSAEALRVTDRVTYQSTGSGTRGQVRADSGGLGAVGGLHVWCGRGSCRCARTWITTVPPMSAIPISSIIRKRLFAA